MPFTSALPICRWRSAAGRCSTTSTPPVATAIQHILARAQEHDVVAGIHNGTAETARRRLEMGFRFVSISSDARLMAAGAQQALAQVRR